MSPEIEGGAGVRKLAYCAGGFSAAIFLAHFLLPARWVLPGALAAVVLALVTLLLLGQTRRRVMAALLSAAIGFGWYAAASALRLTPVQNVSGDVQTVTARVTEYPVAYARSYGLTALLTSPDVPNCKARLYVSDADAAALRPGDEITADVKFRPSTLRYGEETDAYISKGIYLIGSAIKHYPGLGSVTGNTDFTANGILDTTTTLDGPEISAFNSTLEASPSMVMMSLATYQAIDPNNPAVFSSTLVTGYLRGKIGFQGVVTSDSLSATALSGVQPSDLGVRLVEAGGDLACIGASSYVQPVLDGLNAKAAGDATFARKVQQSAIRVMTLKYEMGLAR